MPRTTDSGFGAVMLSVAGYTCGVIPRRVAFSGCTVGLYCSPIDSDYISVTGGLSVSFVIATGYCARNGAWYQLVSLFMVVSLFMLVWLVMALRLLAMRETGCGCVVANVSMAGSGCVNGSS